MHSILQLTLGLCVLFGAPLAFSAPPDLLEDGEYCKAIAAKSTGRAKLFPSAWEKDGPRHSLFTARAKDPEAILALDQLAHNLNSNYLRSMVDSTYLRLSAAGEMGLDLQPYRVALAAAATYCSQPDASGKSLAHEASRLAKLPDEVNADFNAFSIRPQSELYMRRLTVAVLESRRIHTVLKSLQRRLRGLSEGSPQYRELNPVALAYMRRLLRLQHRYPTLAVSGTFVNSVRTLENRVESALGEDNAVLQRPLRAIYFSGPNLEEKLSLNPSGELGAELPLVPVQAELDGGGEDYYRDLYAAILSGKRVLPEILKDELKDAIDHSVRESFSSMILKCQNISPCKALSTHPQLAAERIDRDGKTERLAPLVCACHINEQHEWLSGSQTFGLGIASFVSFTAASLAPEGAIVVGGLTLTPPGAAATGLVGLAYLLGTADAVAAAAGMQDAYVNVNRANLLGLMRAGGAVEPLLEFDMENEYASQRYNAYYNVITGAIGIFPPGRIMTRTAGFGARDMVRSREFLSQTRLEFGKASTGYPAPNLRLDKYETTFDPRDSLAPTPMRLRESYPKLAATLDSASHFAKDSDLFLRDVLLSRLKEAARAMATSGDANDQRLLQSGLIRSDLLPDRTPFTEFPFVVRATR